MDSLISMHIVPFMGLLGLLEAKYLQVPEIFHTLIAILCDFNPLIDGNVSRTKRYLRALLSREPELVQCLLIFLDEPQFINDPNAPQTASPSTSLNPHSDGQPQGGSTSGSQPSRTNPDPQTQQQPHTPCDAAAYPLLSGNLNPLHPNAELSQDETMSESAGWASVLGGGMQGRCGTGPGTKPSGTDSDAGQNNKSAAGAAGCSASCEAGESNNKKAGGTKTPAELNNPFLAGAQPGRMDQMYLMHPQLVPLVNFQTGGLLGTEPWVIPAACPHQHPMTLNAALPFLIPTHFIPTTCMQNMPPATSVQSMQANSEAGGAGAGTTSTMFSTPTQGIPLANLFGNIGVDTNTPSSSKTDACSQGLRPDRGKSVLQTTVGTNTPVTLKPAAKGGNNRNQRNKSTSATATRQSIVPSTATPSSSPSFTFNAATQPASAKPVVTMGLSLSQLLGQPSVAPPGSYLDKRNCIMGTSNLLTPCSQKRPVIIATSGSRSTEVKSLSSKASQGDPSVTQGIGIAPNIGNKVTGVRSITPAVTRPTTTASSVSKVSPILHSSEILQASSPNPGKPQNSSFSSDGKTHTVHVSLGSTHSLAAFPYIQEIVLPDTQVGQNHVADPGGKVGVSALKLQTGGVQVTTPGTHTKQQPGNALKLGTNTPCPQAQKPSQGLSTADCAAKLQSLAQASIHASKQMSQISVGIKNHTISPGQVVIESSMPQAQNLLPFSENQSVNMQGSQGNQPTFTHNTFIPLAGTSTGKVKVKRKRAATSGSTPPFIKPATKKNKEIL